MGSKSFSQAICNTCFAGRPDRQASRVRACRSRVLSAGAVPMYSRVPPAADMASRSMWRNIDPPPFRRPLQAYRLPPPIIFSPSIEIAQNTHEQESVRHDSRSRSPRRAQEDHLVQERSPRPRSLRRAQEDQLVQERSPRRAQGDRLDAPPTVRNVRIHYQERLRESRKADKLIHPSLVKG